MADYISREAEIQFFNKWKDDLDKQIDDSVGYPHLRSDYKVCKTQLLDCIHAIKEIPAADVRPAIRCNNCRYYFLGDCTHNQGMKKTDKDGFCFRFEAVSNE